MLWDVEFLVPNYGLWWTRWALYVMHWNVPRYAERGNRNSTLCITWKKKASHVALRIHKYGEGTIRVGVTDDAVYCFKGWLRCEISFSIITVLDRWTRKSDCVAEWQLLFHGTERGTIRYAMERRIPSTTLWSLMVSLSAIRYALERRINRTALCGTWK